MNFDQVLESLRASQALEAAKALEDKMHSSVNQVASDGDASPITGNDSNLNSTAVVVHDLSSDLTPEFRHSTPGKSHYTFILLLLLMILPSCSI